MSISGGRQSIVLSQSGLTFDAVAGAFAEPLQTFGVLNGGQGLMNWTATATVLGPAGTNWLIISPQSGSSDAASLKVPRVEVSVNPTGLPAGQYYGQVRVSGDSADNAPQFVSVVLNVLPPGSNPGPVVRPTGLIFTGVAGAGSPGSQNIAVANVTNTAATFASSRLTYDHGNWLTHTPSDALVTPGAPTQVVVQADVTGLNSGILRGVTTFLFGDNSTRTVNVLFVVAPAGTALGKSIRTADSACAPKKLEPLFTSLASQFALAASWPATVSVKVVDDCGSPMTAGAVTASFSNGDPPIPLRSLKDGNWIGTWNVRNAVSAQTTVSIAAEIPPQKLKGLTQVSGNIQANSNPPVISEGAIVHAANFASQLPLAPGSMTTIFGSRLSDQTGSANSLPLGTQLAGSSVTIAGRRMPLLYASDGQINAQIPYGIPVNTHHQIIVQPGNTHTAPQPVTVAAAQPAIFTKDQSGSGQGIIVDVRNQIVDAVAPVKAKDVIVIYCTGLGEVSPPVPEGAAPSSPLSQVASPVFVRIGGKDASVLFAGLVPGFPGLYQVNAIVPDGVAPGNATPVILLVAEQISQPVTIATR